MAYKIDLKTEPVPTVPKLLTGAEAEMLHAPFARTFTWRNRLPRKQLPPSVNAIGHRCLARA